MSECPYVKDTGSCPVPGCPVCHSANNVSEKARDKAERAKAEGNDAYKNQDFKTALRHYSLAVNLVPTSHVYRSNRSAAYSGLGQYKEALEDAQKTIELNREWAKGYARAGLAFKVRVQHTSKRMQDYSPNGREKKNQIKITPPSKTHDRGCATSIWLPMPTRRRVTSVRYVANETHTHTLHTYTGHGREPPERDGVSPGSGFQRLLEGG